MCMSSIPGRSSANSAKSSRWRRAREDFRCRRRERIGWPVRPRGGGQSWVDLAEEVFFLEHYRCVGSGAVGKKTEGLAAPSRAFYEPDVLKLPPPRRCRRIVA